jgi:hypothetical protein
MRYYILLFIGLVSLEGHSLGKDIKGGYKETKYPILNYYDESDILRRIKNLVKEKDCSSLLNLYKFVDRDKVAPVGLRKKEAFFYARYIGIKNFIWEKLKGLYYKQQCNKKEEYQDLKNVIVERDSISEGIKAIEGANYLYLQNIVKKNKIVYKIYKLIESGTKNEGFKLKRSKTIVFKQKQRIPLAKCDISDDYISKYPKRDFFYKLNDYIIFFDGGKIFVYNARSHTYYSMDFYDIIKPRLGVKYYTDFKEIIGVMGQGQRIYVTLFSGRFFEGNTYERIGLNSSEIHKFFVPTYKLVAFDVATKKVVWEYDVGSNFSLFSSPFIIANAGYAIAGELADREIKYYLIKFNVERGNLIDKLFIGTDEIGAIARTLASAIYLEASDFYIYGNYLFSVINSSGIVLKYDFQKEWIVYIIRFRGTGSITLPHNYNGLQIGRVEKILFFSFPQHIGYFAIDVDTGKLYSALPSLLSGYSIRRCSVLNNKFVCLDKNNEILVFNEKSVKIIKLKGVSELLVKDKSVFVTKGAFLYSLKKIHFPKKNNFLPLWQFEKSEKVVDAEFIRNTLLVKLKNRKKCYIDILSEEEKK